MSKEKIEKWLNKQIELRKKLVKSENLSKKICAISGTNSSSLHIHRGLGIIADALGAEVITRDFGSENYPIERYFMYGDVKVFSIYQSLEEDINGYEDI